MTAPVLIVGAGPVGLTMAIELTRFGVPVRIIDKIATRTDKSKALVLWSRSLEMLERSGVSHQLVDAGYKVQGISITADQKAVAHITMDGLDTRYAYALMLPQSETERILEQHLNSIGTQIERDVELLNFSEESGGIGFKLRLADSTESTGQASWLVGCDGAHSTVRHLLGKEFAGKTSLVDWLLADVHVQGIPSPTEITINWHQDGVLAIFPITSDRFRVVADIGSAHDGSARLPQPTLADVQTLLNVRLSKEAVASDGVWISAFRINERKVADYRGGRAFLAGDAAHVHSPMGGQGMNTGIQDACNLAWKLALVSRDLAPAALLDSYTPERSPVAEAVVAETGRITSIATVKNRLVQSLRNHATSLVFGLAPVRELASTLASEISVEYSHSPLNAPDRHLSPLPGQRAPIDASAPVTGSGDTPRFVLFGEGNEIPAEVISRFENILDPLLHKPFSSEGLWLVRPDGYVALSTKAGNWKGVSDYLEQFVREGQVQR